MAAAAIEKHRCRICGCTDDNACIAIHSPGGERRNCSWADASRTLCDNPDCLAKAGDRAPEMAS